MRGPLFNVDMTTAIDDEKLREACEWFPGGAGLFIVSRLRRNPDRKVSFFRENGGRHNCLLFNSEYPEGTPTVSVTEFLQVVEGL